MLTHTNNRLVEEEVPPPVGVRRFGRLSLVKSADNKNTNLKDTHTPSHWEIDEEEEDLEITLQARVASGLRHIPKIAAPVTFLVLLGLWQLLTALAVYPAYILPAPAIVAERWLETAQSGALWRHTQVTLLEAGLGFGAALLVVSL